MTLPSSLDCPISKLDHDLLWNIFTLNVTDSLANFWYPLAETHCSPLTTTRRCSQVCTFWREIIMESPSIWGKCIDLDVLGQETNDWRDEVLRRTGNALLSVRASHRNAITSGTGVHEFLIDLIHEHWERIYLFDVTVKSDETLNDARVWSAFSRPARYLMGFSIFSVGHPLNAPSTLVHPANFRLFSDDAPLLTHFSLRNCHQVIVPLSVHPFPSVLLTGRLRTLSLHQPMELAATDLLNACEQMPHLELLAMTLRRLLLDDGQNILSSSRPHVALPRLKAISIAAPCLEIYPAFLGRIVTCPGCTLQMETTLSRTEVVQATQTVTPSVQAMQRILAQYASALFDHYRDGSHPVTDLSLGILSGALNFTTYHPQFYLRLMSSTTIPKHILNSLLNTISTLRFPDTIFRLGFFMSMTSEDPRLTNSTLSKLFLGLSSVTELSTTPTCLSYLSRLSEGEDSVVFPLLKAVFLCGSDIFQNKAQYIKPFIANRRHSTPIEVLNFTKSHWPLGDLRFLEEVTGLKVIWVQDNVVMEYICGSGRPEMLLLQSNGDESTSRIFE